MQFLIDLIIVGYEVEMRSIGREDWEAGWVEENLSVQVSMWYTVRAPEYLRCWGKRLPFV